MPPSLLYTVTLILFFSIGSGYCLSGTGGTPLGGMGTGYVKFDARTGDFAASGKIPPPASDQQNEFLNKKSSSSGFHFFVDDTAVIKASTENEDAKCPLYKADFGKVLDISFELSAFGPFIPGNSDWKIQLSQSPLAFFEITANNTGSTAVQVAAAMEFSNCSAAGINLLGGEDSGAATADNCALAFGNSTDENACLLVACTNNDAVFSAGAIGTFTADGILAKGTGNLVAAKCAVAPGAQVRFKFVLAWYRQFCNDTLGLVEDYYYHNYYDNSLDAAEYGMRHFDAVSSGVKKTVARVMGSNFPDWYKERLLNNLYPLINNMQCAKDGRAAFWEGQYPIIGSIDRQETAQLFFTFNWPEVQWRHMMFWARTQHTGVGEDAELLGQIHHDFNKSPPSWTDTSHFLCPWDDYLRDDYWYQPNTLKVSILNSMFILGVYELMLATADRDSMAGIWPYVQNTGNRLIQQSEDNGRHIPLYHDPFSSDPPLDLTPFHASMALNAYNALVEMAKFLGDTVYTEKFRKQYSLGMSEYPDFVKNYYEQYSTKTEDNVSGYSWSHYLGFPALLDSSLIKQAFTFFDNLLPTNNGKKVISREHFSLCDNLGGAAIVTGNPDIAMEYYKTDYELYHTDNPAFVFWQNRWTPDTVYASNCEAPSVWRSYFQMTGYLLDNAFKRLWIRPTVPTELNGTITNAPLLNPSGWGELNYEETDSDSIVQKISVKFDSTVTVREFVFRNNTGNETPYVYFNGTTVPSLVEGSGYEKNIRVTVPEPVAIGPNGIEIVISKRPLAIYHQCTRRTLASRSALLTTIIGTNGFIRFSTGSNGPVTLDLLSVNGRRIAVIADSYFAKGTHTLKWNENHTVNQAIGSMIAILRLSTATGRAYQTVIIK